MGQSELEVNTCSRCQERENSREQVVTFLVFLRFTSNWLKKWREFFNQSQSTVTGIDFDFSPQRNTSKTYTTVLSTSSRMKQINVAKENKFGN